MQVHIEENQFVTMEIMSLIAEQTRIDYLEVPDTKYVTQPVEDFLFFGRRRWDQPKTQSKKMNMGASQKESRTSVGTSYRSAFNREPTEP